MSLTNLISQAAEHTSMHSHEHTYTQTAGIVTFTWSFLARVVTAVTEPTNSSAIPEKKEGGVVCES